MESEGLDLNSGSGSCSSEYVVPDVHCTMGGVSDRCGIVRAWKCLVGNDH